MKFQGIQNTQDCIRKRYIKEYIYRLANCYIWLSKNWRVGFLLGFLCYNLIIFEFEGTIALIYIETVDKSSDEAKVIMAYNWHQ